jgi:peptidoglycan hydrolase-like protein with peptidoglycan-binding domain
MMKRSRNLRVPRCSAVLLTLAVATMPPAAAPVAGDAEIVARGADGAPGHVPFNLIKAAQRFLVDQGYRPGPVDGVIGPMTQAAVMAWQRDHDLEADGSLNTATLISMGLAPQ